MTELSTDPHNTEILFLKDTTSQSLSEAVRSTVWQGVNISNSIRTNVRSVIVSIIIDEKQMISCRLMAIRR